MDDEDDDYVDNVAMLTKHVQRDMDVECIVRKYAEKINHDSCWYYPELFDELCGLYNIPKPKRPTITEDEFRAGCDKYRKELYDREV